MYQTQMRTIDCVTTVCESLYFGAVLFVIFCFYYFTSSLSGTRSKAKMVLPTSCTALRNNSLSS